MGRDSQNEPQQKKIIESATEAGHARRMALIGALLTAAVGAIIAWGIWRYAKDVGEDQGPQAVMMTIFSRGGFSRRQRATARQRRLKPPLYLFTGQTGGAT